MYSFTELTTIRNTVTAKNFEPEYLQINPKGTIPSLTAPSLAKPLVDSVDILEYLDRCRPDTTPLIPTDPSSKARVKQLIDFVHSAKADTNLILLQARRHNELEGKKKSPWMTFLSNRQAVLEKYRAEDHSHPFYERRAAEDGALLRLYTSEPTDEHTKFFERTHAQYRDFAVGLDNLNSLLVLPYAAGESITAADLHLVPWLAHAVRGAGGHEIDDFAPLEKLIQVSVPEFHIGVRTREW
jgi:glutathione S-transferase